MSDVADTALKRMILLGRMKAAGWSDDPHSMTEQRNITVSDGRQPD